MAKIDQMLRIKFIEDLLRRRKDSGASFKDIKDYLEKKFAEKDKLGDLKFTPRTFLRDKEMIREVSGIEISYSRAKDTYYIKSEELDIYKENIFDNMLLVEAYRETKNHAELMIFEPRKSRGLENLTGLIHAIKNRKVLRFTYQKFWDGEKRNRSVEPYALKEFEHRWYLLAKEFNAKDGQNFMKTFALDRISGIEIKPKTFKREPYNPVEAFKDSFGIISSEGKKPQEIILWFDEHQGNYIKSMPLHHSQEILEDGKESLKIKLFLVPTYDFKQAILSYGGTVEVLEPKSFREELKQEISKMMEVYEK